MQRLPFNVCHVFSLTAKDAVRLCVKECAALENLAAKETRLE